jgi:hypothetical protein
LGYIMTSGYSYSIGRSPSTYSLGQSPSAYSLGRSPSSYSIGPENLFHATNSTSFCHKKKTKKSYVPIGRSPSAHDFTMARSRSSANLRHSLLYSGPTVRIPLTRSSTLPDVFSNVRGKYKRYDQRWPNTYTTKNAYSSYETYKNTDYAGYDRMYLPGYMEYLKNRPPSHRCHYRRSQTTGPARRVKWNWDNTSPRYDVTSHITTTYTPMRPYDSKLLRMEDRYIPFSVISSIHRWK